MKNTPKRAPTLVQIPDAKRSGLYAPLARSRRFARTVRAVDTKMEVQTLEIFLTIASSTGIRQAELTELLGIPQSTVSRHLNMLAGGNDERDGEASARVGLRLIETIVDPRDARKRRYALTLTGEAFARALAANQDD